ncbi:MAG TPA: hypothetical protein VIK25_12805 [Gemmatimonadaceae bacterium]
MLALTPGDKSEARKAPAKDSVITVATTAAVPAALLACFLFIPMVNATFVLFPTASGARQTWWFPERINNAVLLWAVVNGRIGLALFWLSFRFHGRKRGVLRAPSCGVRRLPHRLPVPVRIGMRASGNGSACVSADSATRWASR